ncbi:hypothetical protein FRC08_012794 [Ceratobasidium sp. 394]|nr:hypothetical protein FRC08_012794 [Ceratobasidium sp. 394]
MPLRQATLADLDSLKALRDAAQKHLEAKGSRQILSHIDESAIGEYWLFSSTAPTSVPTNANVPDTPSTSHMDAAIPSNKLSDARSIASLPTLFGSFPTGSSRVSRCIPVHIKPHLPQVSLPLGPQELDTRPSYTYLYLSSVIIHPQLQRKGLGQQMILELQQLFTSTSGQASSFQAIDPSIRLALDVWAGNTRLRLWYQSLGWRHVATVEEADDSTQRMSLLFCVSDNI